MLPANLLRKVASSLADDNAASFAQSHRAAHSATALERQQRLQRHTALTNTWLWSSRW